MPWKIDISSDSLAVTVDLRQLGKEEELAAEEIITALQEKQIPIDPAVEQRVNGLLEELTAAGKKTGLHVLLQAEEPQPGEDGYFEWSEKCDPEKQKLALEERLKADQASFYECSCLIIVTKGDVLGVLHPPTNGQPGRDVFGRPITPQPGVDCVIEPGKNVEVAHDGHTFIAACDGEPKKEGNILAVDPTLSVKSSVDFSTGNIHYSGDVNIKGDVKDVFEVIAGGSVTVEGTIEAARVECGGNLFVKRGISGKEKGTVVVKKDLTAKYLSNVSAWVEGNVQIDSEIVNADLNCRGKVVLSKGAIHGGQVTASGNVEAPVVGSSAGVRTIIRAGIDPYLEKKINAMNEERSRLSKIISTLFPQAKVLLEISQGRGDPQLDRLAAQIKKAKEKIEKIDAEKKRLSDESSQNCKGTIIVSKLIYPGVVFYIGSCVHVNNNELLGPVEVVLEKQEDQGQIINFRVPLKNASDKNAPDKAAADKATPDKTAPAKV